MTKRKDRRLSGVRKQYRKHEWCWGARLREARQNAGVRQSTLARHLGMKRQNYGEKEGMVRPTFPAVRMRRLKKRLGVTLRDLRRPMEGELVKIQLPPRPVNRRKFSEQELLGVLRRRLNGQSWYKCSIRLGTTEAILRAVLRQKGYFV